MSDDVDGLARVPAIRSEFRLQYEPAQEAHVLLYPEGMVKLNFAACVYLSGWNLKISIRKRDLILRRA